MLSGSWRAISQVPGLSQSIISGQFVGALGETVSLGGFVVNGGD